MGLLETETFFVSCRQGFPSGAVTKNLPDNAGDARDGGSIPELGRPPGEGNGIYSSILVWEIPWIEESGRLQSIGSHTP